MKLTAKKADRLSGEIYAGDERVENITILKSTPAGEGKYILKVEIEIGRSNEINKRVKRNVDTGVVKQPKPTESGTGDYIADIPHG